MRHTINLWPKWAANTEAVQFGFSTGQYAWFSSPKHGPTSWPWWKLFKVSIVECNPVTKLSKGWNIWIYTRWGAYCPDFFIAKGKPRISVGTIKEKRRK